MGVRIGTAMVIDGDARSAAVEAAVEARDGLGGRPADLALVFAAGGHLRDPASALEGVQRASRRGRSSACGAAGVLGGPPRDRDGHRGVGLGGGVRRGRGRDVPRPPRGDAGRLLIRGIPDLAGAAGALLLPIPQLPDRRGPRRPRGRAPGVPVLGGLASALDAEGDVVLFCDDEVVHGGRRGRAPGGVELLPLVSQGATPLGPS
jgi:small ligand-binding sensory domain FIST